MSARKMIAARVVGCSISPDYRHRNPHLKFATGPDDTGVIASWHTEAPAAEATATAGQNLGSLELTPPYGLPHLAKNGNVTRVMNLADVRVDRVRGVPMCGAVNPLYLFDVRANAATRPSPSLRLRRGDRRAGGWAAAATPAAPARGSTKREDKDSLTVASRTAVRRLARREEDNDLREFLIFPRSTTPPRRLRRLRRAMSAFSRPSIRRLNAQADGRGWSCAANRVEQFFARNQGDR